MIVFHIVFCQKIKIGSKCKLDTIYAIYATAKMEEKALNPKTEARTAAALRRFTLEADITQSFKEGNTIHRFLRKRIMVDHTIRIVQLLFSSEFVSTVAISKTRFR